MFQEQIKAIQELIAKQDLEIKGLKDQIKHKYLLKRKNKVLLNKVIKFQGLLGVDDEEDEN